MPSPEVARRLEARLDELYRRHLPDNDHDVANYYSPARGYYPPEPSASEHDRFGICLATVDGYTYRAGDADVGFALQSLSKVFVYGLALADHGRDEVLRRVGVEPSGDAFNSLVFDEHTNRPFNPMVNAGALATTDMVRGDSDAEKLERVLDTLRRYAGNDALAVDPATFDAEHRGADHNRATAYLMRSTGMLGGDVEATLARYLRACAVQVTCRDLAVMAATLANGGTNPTTGDLALPRERVRDVLSVMYTSGMYDFAGEWAYEVGVPAKSGVSGGLLAVIPGKMGIGVYSPGLDRFGNSVRGTRVCKELSERLGLHLFATDDEDHLLDPRPTPGPAGAGADGGDDLLGARPGIRRVRTPTRLRRASMYVREVMSSPAVTVAPATPVKVAAAQMFGEGFTSLPVLDPDGSLVGVVNEADLLIHRFPPDPRAAGPRPPLPDAGTTVGDVMHTDVLSARPQDGVSDLVVALRDAGVRAVPVVDRDRVVGMVTYGDLLRAMARDDQLIAVDVERRLGVHSDHRHWQVAVDAGEVTLTGDEPDPVDRQTAQLIAEAVIGTTVVHLHDPAVTE